MRNSDDKATTTPPPPGKQPEGLGKRKTSIIKMKNKKEEGKQEKI